MALFVRAWLCQARPRPVDILTSAPDAEQARDLANTLDRLSGLAHELERVLNAWHRGDVVGPAAAA